MTRRARSEERILSRCWRRSRVPFPHTRQISIISASGTCQISAPACFTNHLISCHENRPAGEMRHGADATPPTHQDCLWCTRNRRRTGNDATGHAGFPGTPAHRSKAFPQPVQWPRPAQEGIRFQAPVAALHTMPQLARLQPRRAAEYAADSRPPDSCQ